MLRFTAIALVVFLAPLPASASDLRIGGTGNALGTMSILTEAYAKANPNAKPTVLSSIGSSGAIRAVPKGAINIGLSSRPLTEEEAASGMVSVEYARSPTVFAVQTSSPVNSITIRQVADIYSGKLEVWPNGSRIRPVMRQAGDDNTKQIRGLSPEIEKALLVAEQRTGLTFASNDQEAADKMESIQGSIGVTALALIRSEKRNLKPLALDGIEATPENARNGRYPIVKHFYFILPKVPSAEAEAFLAFVKSPEARRIFEENGHFIP